MAGFDGGDVDREGAVEGCEATGAFLDGRDGTENDELIAVKAGARIVIGEDMLRRGDDAAFAAPDFV